jgi:hypothetical protein
MQRCRQQDRAQPGRHLEAERGQRRPDARNRRERIQDSAATTARRAITGVSMTAAELVVWMRMNVIAATPSALAGVVGGAAEYPTA